MTTPRPRPTRTPVSPFMEEDDLVHLRARYQLDRGLFPRHELARLRFLRWLFQTGRLTP